jgi:hypothetical protein
VAGASSMAKPYQIRTCDTSRSDKPLELVRHTNPRRAQLPGRKWVLEITPASCVALSDVRHFTIELEELNQHLMQMGGSVASAIHLAVRSLIEQNRVLAEEATPSTGTCCMSCRAIRL